MRYRARYRVIELLDGDGRPVWIEAAPVDGDAPWRAIWMYRWLVETPLALWLRSLPAEPTEQVFLGQGAALDAGTARRLARFRRGELLAQGVPVLVEPDCRGRHHGRRTVVVGGDGKIEVYSTLADAARHEGVVRSLLSTRHLRGLPGRGRRCV